MYIRKILFIIPFFLLFGQFSIFSLTKNQDVELSIRYYDRTVYFPGDSESNPVLVHVSIKNKGLEPLRFKLADDRMFSMDFNAFTVKNTNLPLTESLVRKRTTNQTVYFREITLEYGEEYSFVENLKEYVDITEPSIYYFELNFFPELYKSQNIELKSNRLTLEILPSPSQASSSFLPVLQDKATILKPLELSPDKVVEQTIIARQKSLWDQYFLYMDLEAMLQRNQSQKRKYITVSSDERIRMLKNYKADLMQSRIDTDIVAVPESFRIDKTVYSNNEGTVTVTEWFKYPNFHEKKSFIYKVRQREGIWQIYDYNVTNLGTE